MSSADEHGLTNPCSPQTGVWGYHCHIAWHASGGFFSTFIVKSDAVQAFRIPDTIRQTCDDWDAWTSQTVVDHIDSGL